MPKGNRKQQKRQSEIAQKALESEIKRNDEKIPDIVPDSALFKEDDDEEKVKKTKIRLNPRPLLEKKTQPPKTEFTDLWGDDNSETAKKAKLLKKAKQGKMKKANLPTSSESYTSKDLITTKRKKVDDVLETKEEDVQAFDPAEEMGEEGEYNDGIGDSTIGDVPVQPEGLDKIVVPEPEKKQMKDIILSVHIPQNMPHQERAIKRKMMRDNNKLVKAQQRDQLDPEFEATTEAAKEIEEHQKEIASRPKKEHVNPKEQYIIDEPKYQMDKVPESLGDVSGDTAQFTRFQRDLEIRGLTPLHH